MRIIAYVIVDTFSGRTSAFDSAMSVNESVNVGG